MLDGVPPWDGGAAAAEIGDHRLCGALDSGFVNFIHLKNYFYLIMISKVENLFRLIIRRIFILFCYKVEKLNL